MSELSGSGAERPRDPLLPRHTLAGRYTIERELGRGGMATVYLATDLRQERLVALKVLRAEFVAQVHADRFHREIRTVSRLVHPHILSLFEAGEADGQIYFAMPYVAGETLRWRIEREQQLPTADAVRLTCEIADALAHAHSLGIVHRDIKPENILLSGGHAVVADFGISRVAEEALTSTGLVVGTPDYMSPEQASGDREVDGRSDIYSLACVLYTMLTGRPLFKGTTPREVAAQQVTSPPPSVRTVRPDVPAAIDAVLQRALAKDPEARFDNAREFATALTDAWRQSERPMGWPPPRVSPYAAAALIAALVLAAVLLWDRWRGPSNRDALQPDMVAVAPFFVASSDPELKRWKYDLPGLVTPQLDGAKPLRALSTVTEMSDRPDVMDRASATEHGQRHGASYVVFGRIVGDRRHTVRVNAEVVDVARGEVIDRIQITGVASEDDGGSLLMQVSDLLTRALLSSFNASMRVAATRNAASGCASPSWPAIQKYLHGESFYRRTQWDSAITAYQAAIEDDSTCALAYRRIAIAQSWQRSDGDSVVLHYKRLAGAYNHGLPPRDSLLVLSDSLTASIYDLYRGPDTPASHYWAQVQRLLATLEEASRQYPGDAEVWYALGEARYHWGWGPSATTGREIRAAFDRAIRQDSGFALSYLHPIELGLAEGGVSLARPYLDGYLATNPTDVNAEGVRLVALLIDSARARTGETAGRLATDSLDWVIAARNLLDRWHDPTETTVRLTTIVAARRGADTLQIARCSGAYPPSGTLAIRLAYRGHLGAAYCALGDSAGLGGSGSALIELALLGGAPEESTTRIFDTWVRNGIGFPNYTLAWWAARRDTVHIDVFAARADSLLRWSTNPRRQEKARYDVAAARAYRALARLDTTEALRRFATLSRTQCTGCFDFDRIVEAQLLARRDSAHAAYRILGEWRGASAVPSDILIAYERARVAERIGERAEAIASYRTVVNAWAKADPVLRPLVKDARDALARLEGKVGITASASIRR